MPHSYDNIRAWVEECKTDRGLIYILVIEKNLSQDSFVLGKAVSNDKTKPDKIESFCHSWRRHLAEILGTNYNPSKTALLQYFAKEKLTPLPTIDDIILAGKAIEYLAKLEPGIENPENLKGTLSQVGEHTVTQEELQKLHEYFLNRKLPYPF